MVTRILRVPRYSGCSRKNFVIILDEATLAAWSLDGSRTSHVAKLLLQKYWHGTPAFLRRSSNPSFFRPTSRLVFWSVTTRETILGSSFFDEFRDGQNLIALKIVGIFAHPVLLVFVRPILYDFPWWRIFMLALLPWWYRASWFRRKGWPVWADQAQRLQLFRLPREGFFFLIIRSWDIVVGRVNKLFIRWRGGRRRPLHDCQKKNSNQEG